MEKNIEELGLHFNRTRISIYDFEEAKEFIVSYNEELPHQIRKALISSAIVSYARPFTDNSRGEHPVAAPRIKESILKTLPPDLRDLHYKILRLRQKAIAHSEYEYRAFRRLRTVGPRGFVVQGRPFDILTFENEMKNFERLCIEAHNHYTDKLFALNALIIKKTPPES